MTKGPLVLAVSDATGDTAVHMARAALAQFGHVPDSAILLASHIRNTEDVDRVLEKAQSLGCVVAYTLVEAELRAHLRALADVQAIPAVDLLGPLIGRLSGALGKRPKAVPGLSHVLDDDYFRRIEAVEFAVYNDDGKHPANLHRADIVILGISRTSKTPLSNYIAQRGLKVANVPIVLDIPLPIEVEDLDPQRVFGLQIDVATLSRIRRTRLEALGVGAESDYGDLRHIRQEVTWARNLFRKHPEWTIIDVTRKAVEETASTLLEIYRDRFGGDGLDLPGSESESARKTGARPTPKKAGTAAKKKSGGKSPAKKRAAKKGASKKTAAKKAPAKRATKRATKRGAAKKSTKKSPRPRTRR